MYKFFSKFPKTDYTYSENSKDRIELAPGIVAMPNMSRRALHSYDSTSNVSTNTDAEFTKYESFNVSSGRRQEYTSSKSSSIVTRISRTIQTVFVWLFHLTYIDRLGTASWSVKTASTLHKLVSKIMMLDCWLLQGETKKVSSIVKICLIPLILFGGMYNIN